MCGYNICVARTHYTSVVYDSLSVQQLLCPENISIVTLVKFFSHIKMHVFHNYYDMNKTWDGHIPKKKKIWSCFSHISATYVGSSNLLLASSFNCNICLRCLFSFLSVKFCTELPKHGCISFQFWLGIGKGCTCIFSGWFSFFKVFHCYVIWYPLFFPEMNDLILSFP